MDEKPTEEHYSLRWNNHQAHLLRAFEALLHAENLVDVTLVCAERRVRAHKVLLGACSPLFRRIFSENPCKHPVIVLKDFHGWEVQALVDFMYRGEVSVAQEQLSTVIRAGESLQVRGLVEYERGEEITSPPTPMEASLPEQTPLAPSPPTSPASPIPRRKQARPRRRSGESDTPENLSMRRSPSSSLKAVRLARPRSPAPAKQEQAEEAEAEVPPQLPRMYPPHQDLFPPVPSTVSALSLTPPHNKYLITN